MSVIRGSCVRATNGRVIASRGPARLAEGNVDIAGTEGLHGGVDGVDEGVELVGVGELGVWVKQARAGPEEGEVDVGWVMVKVWVWVEHEWGMGLTKEFQHWAQHVLCEPGPELARTWGCCSPHDN